MIKNNSYYKIKRINEKYKIFKKKKKIIELGSFPGGWSFYIKNLKLDDFISIDLKKSLLNQNFLIGSFNNVIIKKKVKNKFKVKVDLIISDSCPKLTNNKILNKIFLERHLKKIIIFCFEFLKKKGSILYKTMDYISRKEYIFFLKKFKHFKIIKFVKKKRSSEVFFFLKKFLK
ncbi:SAM-dependent methyltransferase [Candidatus Vidania fulgoroideorum]